MTKATPANSIPTTMRASNLNIGGLWRNHFWISIVVAYETFTAKVSKYKFDIPERNFELDKQREYDRLKDRHQNKDENWIEDLHLIGLPVETVRHTAVHFIGLQRPPRSLQSMNHLTMCNKCNNSCEWKYNVLKM